MRIPAIFASMVVHGTVIVGLGLWVQPWVVFVPLDVKLQVVPQDPATEVLSRLPEPKRVRVEPIPETLLTEPEFLDLEEPDPQPDTVLDEPPLPLPYPTPKAIPELTHRVLPVVVEPQVAEASAKPPTEESLEPRPPQDYVRKLHLDPRNKPPKYPALARRLGFEGTVVIAVTVTPEGRAGAVRVLTSAGTSPAHKQMDRVTLRALKRWHYPRILHGDQPMEMVIHVPVEFRLVDKG
ncbi:MAG: TonB family protein [Planctomycetota bacterium]